MVEKHLFSVPIIHISRLLYLFIYFYFLKERKKKKKTELFLGIFVCGNYIYAQHAADGDGLINMVAHSCQCQYCTIEVVRNMHSLLTSWLECSSAILNYRKFGVGIK